MPPTTLLDCTLRDGGYHNQWQFSLPLVEAYLHAMASVGCIGVVELGLRTLSPPAQAGGCATTTDEWIKSLTLPKTGQPLPALAVMVHTNEWSQLPEGLPPIDDAHHPYLVSVLSRLFPAPHALVTKLTWVRLTCQAHQVTSTLHAATWLHHRGYQVALNLAHVGQLSLAQVQAVARQASPYPVGVLTLADSGGALSPQQTRALITACKQAWPKPLGLHAHNNRGLALANTLAALEAGATWADSTVAGMGRGPGNTATELLIQELAHQHNAWPQLATLWAFIHTFMQPLQQQHQWGANLVYAYAGHKGIHPNKVQGLLSQADSWPQQQWQALQVFLQNASQPMC